MDTPSPVSPSSPASISPLWRYDQELIENEGLALLVGIDEAGRGPLAGNVVAGCVILNLNATPLSGLNDSKKINASNRETLYHQIMQQALAYGVGECSPEEIDKFNILGATFLAMRRAYDAMVAKAPAALIAQKPELILIDGNKTVPHLLPLPQRALIKGDGISASIAAASILAKVTRDRQLDELAVKYPQYGFEQHKGYPTEAHRIAVKEHGLSPVHRRSFCSDLFGQTDLFG